MTDFDEMFQSLGEDLEKDWDDEMESLDIAGLSPAELDSLIHTLLARRMVESLRDPARCTPGLMQCALRFLKDNDITALPVPGSVQKKLRDRLEASIPFPTPRLTGTDS